MRHSRKSLDEIVVKLNELTGNKNGFYLNNQIGIGMRLIAASGRDVSPRLKPTTLHDWLEAYHAGIMLGLHNIV